MADAACTIAFAGAEARQACTRFGRAFGVAFQIADDVLSFAPRRGFRKVAGEDLSSGKLTYVTSEALRCLTGRDRRRLEAILCSPALRAEPATHREGLALVRRSGALEGCRRESVALFEAEWASLMPHLRSFVPAMMLRGLCTQLLGGTATRPRPTKA